MNVLIEAKLIEGTQLTIEEQSDLYKEFERLKGIEEELEYFSVMNKDNLTLSQNEQIKSILEGEL